MGLPSAPAGIIALAQLGTLGTAARVLRDTIGAEHWVPFCSHPPAVQLHVPFAMARTAPGASVGPRGHSGQPLPGSVCKGSQTAEFPTAALVLITANQWMPDSGQSKPLLPRSQGLLGRWAAVGAGTWDGSADPAHCTSAFPDARKSHVPQPPVLTASQLCLVQLHCVWGSRQPLCPPCAHAGAPCGRCSALGTSSCSQLLACLQPRAVIQPYFPAGFAQTFLVSLCLF